MERCRRMEGVDVNTIYPQRIQMEKRDHGMTDLYGSHSLQYLSRQAQTEEWRGEHHTDFEQISEGYRKGSN